MKKRIVSLCLALTFVFVSAFGSFAATSTGAMGLADFKRFQDVVSENRQKTAKVVNYEQLSNGHWMLYLRVRDAERKADQCEGDFEVYFVPKDDENVALRTELAKYVGNPCYYYFGLFQGNKLCGYAIAVRRYHALAGQHYTYPQPDNYSIAELQ